MTVEDVGGMPSARINRIVGADFLNLEGSVRSRGAV
jgi:hypothetical protein